jgi:hypothetical protein
MRRIAAFVLLAALTTLWPTAAPAQDPGTAKYAHATQEFGKKQQKLQRKAAKKQQKAYKKFAKQQRAAAKKASHRRSSYKPSIGH